MTEMFLYHTEWIPEDGFIINNRFRVGYWYELIKTGKDWQERPYDGYINLGNTIEGFHPNYNGAGFSDLLLSKELIEKYFWSQTQTREHKINQILSINED